MNNNLNKQTYWNAITANYPQAMAEFSDWIDKYKKEIDWDFIFAHDWRPLHIKFHDLPFDMQRGILTRFFEEILENDYEKRKLEAIDGISEFFNLRNQMLTGEDKKQVSKKEEKKFLNIEVLKDGRFAREIDDFVPVVDKLYEIFSKDKHQSGSRWRAEIMFNKKIKLLYTL